MLIRGEKVLARLAASSGITHVIESLPHRNFLMVLNYHRIGNPAETPYDSALFSATGEELDWQVEYLKRHFQMATLENVVAMANGYRPRGTHVLLTFDDGYRDNYTVAFPVLRSHGVQGVFFLPTSFIGTDRLPWWDVIAYLIKHTFKSTIRLKLPEPVVFELRERGRVINITRQILRLYKRTPLQDCPDFITALEQACEVSAPLAGVNRRFMNWAEAREMLQGGMAFGSHTHTHEIMSKLSPEQQCEEASRSRDRLEQELENHIDVLSYPVGGPDTFTDQTMRILAQAGYSAAFSFQGGLNRIGGIERFNIFRCAVDGPSRAQFRLRTSLGAVTGAGWS